MRSGMIALAFSAMVVTPIMPCSSNRHRSSASRRNCSIGDRAGSARSLASSPRPLSWLSSSGWRSSSRVGWADCGTGANDRKDTILQSLTTLGLTSDSEGRTSPGYHGCGSVGPMSFQSGPVRPQCSSERGKQHRRRHPGQADGSQPRLIRFGVRHTSVPKEPCKCHYASPDRPPRPSSRLFG